MFTNERQLCQSFLSGYCTKSTSCPYVHQYSSSNDNQKDSYCFFSNGVFSSFNNIAKKKSKKKNFFEDFEDDSLKLKKFYSQPDSQKMNELNKEFADFDLFSEIKDSDNNKIKYCKNFLNNKCVNDDCELFHGYNNNFKNITRIFGVSNENVIKILLIDNETFLTATKSIIKIYSVKDKFKSKGEIEVNEFGKNIIEIQNIFTIDKIIFSCEFNTYNKSMIIVMRFQNFNKETQKLSVDSGNKNIGELIFLKNESLILTFGDIYLEMFRTNVANNKIERIQKIQVEKEYGFSSVILFNKEFICGLKNGVIGVLTPNREGSEIFSKRFEVKHHEDEITKLLILEIDSQTHYFISGSLDKKIKLFNYEKDFSLIFSKNMGESINNLFLTKDYNKKFVTMVSLITGIIKVLDDKFNEVFDIRGPNNKNCARYGIEIYIDKDDNIYEDNNDEEENEGSKGNYLILNLGKGIEINKWIKTKS